MTPVILLCGHRNDPPLAAVCRALAELGCEPVLLDRDAALQTTIELNTGRNVGGSLHLPGQTLDLGQIGSLYLRPLESERVSGSQPEGSHLQALQDILYAWADLAPALVLNRPMPMAANDSKPYQSAWLKSLGFRIPETLLTTDADEALSFWQLHGRVIYKSVSGTRSIVSHLTPGHHDRLANVASCPTQFQQYIPGQDYRVHLVADRIFAVAIHSQAVDYRYSPVPFEFTPCDLPAEIAALCRSAARSMKLTLAGLDLRRTPGGEWFCFEVNPSPAFNCFDDPATRPICKAVAHLLANPSEAL